jgi:predicted transcriptional regulator
MSPKRSDLPPRRPRPTPLPVQRALRQIASHRGTWRRLRGVTQAQLADRAAVSTRTIARLEAGEGGASLETVLRVLRGLGLLDTLVDALDPYESDIGRLRASEHLPKRVRPRDLTGTDS